MEEEEMYQSLPLKISKDYALCTNMSSWKVPAFENALRERRAFLSYELSIIIHRSYMTFHVSVSRLHLFATDHCVCIAKFQSNTGTELNHTPQCHDDCVMRIHSPSLLNSGQRQEVQLPKCTWPHLKTCTPRKYPVTENMN